MIHPANSDIVPLIKFLVKGLQPYAAAQHIRLKFKSDKNKLSLAHDAGQLVEIMSGLLCRIIHILSSGNTIHVHLISNSTNCIIRVENTGIDLSRVHEVTAQIKSNLTVTGTTNGTIFEYLLPEIIIDDTPDEKLPPAKSIPSYWRSHYAMIRKRLRSHFSKADLLVEMLSVHHPGDAAFLKRINTLIWTNLENENFDTTSLCREVSMSRTQLFRKLKPLIMQAPAHYIRVMRLQKAKELLETSDLNVGEVTCKTGFQSQSHFTKAFRQYYGFAPSSLRRRANATK